MAKSVNESINPSKVGTAKILNAGNLSQPFEMKPESASNIMNLTYRFEVRIDQTPVEVALRYELERRTVDYILGDLVYSITLLPQEYVWLSFRNRHSVSRFTEDVSYSASTLAKSSDSLWMDTFCTLATDISQDRVTTLTGKSHSSFNIQAEGGYSTNIFSGSGDFKARGDYDSKSASHFSDEIQQHLKSTFNRTDRITRTANSMSIVNVSSHRSVEQEVKDEVKAGVRVFHNINYCHTLNFLFYQIAKRYRAQIALTGVSYRVVDQNVLMRIQENPYDLSLGCNTEIVHLSDQAKLAEKGYAFTRFTSPLSSDQASLSTPREGSGSDDSTSAPKPPVILPDDRDKALRVVKEELPESKFTFEYIKESLLPTNSVFVDAALGSSIACEPYIREKQKLELENLRLKNQHLKREIELLDKHQLYRCCPAKENETEKEKEKEKEKETIK